jgi:uncharacterized SAM-binding protein YcdF (DUF218 family)
MAQGLVKKIMLAFFAGILVCLLLGAGVLLWQKSYYDSLLRPAPPDSRPIQAVVVFSGGLDRLEKGVAEVNQRGVTNLIISSAKINDVRFEILQDGGISPDVKLWVNEKSTTTDADARYAAGILKKIKADRAVLVTSWFHLPRSAFLLRLYLAFSGIQIEPISSDDPPDDAKHERVFEMEFIKLWGSLGRVAAFAFNQYVHPAPKANP